MLPDVRMCMSTFHRDKASTHRAGGVMMLQGWGVGGEGNWGEGRQHLLLNSDGLHGHLLGLQQYHSWGLQVTKC